MLKVTIAQAGDSQLTSDNPSVVVRRCCILVGEQRYRLLLILAQRNSFVGLGTKSLCTRALT